MNKKLIHGLLAVSLLAGTACVFTSCKDTDEDLYARLRQELLDENASLEDKLLTQADVLELIQQQIASQIDSYKCTCQEKWNTLETTKQELKNAIDKNSTDIQTLENKVKQQALDFADTYATLNQLITTKNDLETEIGKIRDTTDDLSDRVVALETARGKVESRLDTIEGFLTDEVKSFINEAMTELPGIEEDVAKALRDASAAQTDATDALNQLSALKGAYTGTLDELDSKITTNYNTLNTRIEALETKVTEIDGIKTDLQTVKNDISTKYNELSSKFDSYVKLSVFNEEISKKVDKTELESLVRTFLSEDLNKISQNGSDISSLKNRVQALEDAGYATTTELSNVKSELKELIDANAANILTLQGDVEELQNDIEELSQKLDKLSGKLDAIANKLNALISSIVVQNVNNPVFGSISTPLGVNTNILLAYYGDVAHPVQFPYGGSQYEYNGVQVLTGAELGALGVTPYTAQSGIMMDESEGNAGKIYLTVNPSSVDATGTSFKLVNSKDEESGIELSPLAKSDTELKFGLTRADNGFYVAKATLPANSTAINKVKINIDSSLKSAMSSVLKTRSRSNVSNLLVQLFKQFEGVLSAEGVKAPWTYTDENGKEVTAATYSNYGIAATAFQPLSFKFLYDSSLPTIPTINTINQIEFDTPNFNFEIKPITIKTPEITLVMNLEEVSIEIDKNLFAVTIDQFPTGYDETTGSLTYEKRVFYVDSADAFEKNLNEQINGAIAKWPDQISGSVEDAVKEAIQSVTDDISSQIDSMLSDISGQISDKVGDLIGSIQDEVNGYVDNVNSYIDNVNSVIGRLNNVLTNPNHYLQVMMAYKANNGNYYQLSNSKKNPTIFTHNGGTGINLLATSYSAEIVVPAFKKYVAVTNVYNADGTTNESLKKQANESGSFNEVINGTQRRVALNIPTSASGCTYEIVYSALDYHGVTSTQKFYLKVK
jgi:gas vesicle protein